MARSGNSNREYVPPTYVNLTLQGSELVAADKWCIDNEADIFDHVDALAGGGWKFTLKYDFNNNCSMVSATKYAPGELNHNVCLTTRGHDLLDALLLAVYKVGVRYATEDLKAIDRDAVRG